MTSLHKLSILVRILYYLIIQIMKKLIDLLNKYMKYKEKFWPDKLTRFKGVDTSWNLLFELKNWAYFQEEYIISKKYWFIKRLNNHDYIDTMKAYDKFDYCTMYQWEWKSDFEIQTDDLIMMLSIQEQPIEFLISILK